MVVPEKSIGLTAAERDPLRKDCFVSISALDALTTANDVVLVQGRMGAGKTALALQLEEKHPRTVVIRPSRGAARGLRSAIKRLDLKDDEDLEEVFEGAWRRLFVLMCAMKVLDDGGKFVGGRMDLLRRYASEQLKRTAPASSSMFLSVMSAAIGQSVKMTNGAPPGERGDSVSDEEAESALHDVLERRGAIQVIVDDIDRTWTNISGVEYGLLRGLACAAASLRDLDDPLYDLIVARCFVPSYPFADALGRQRLKLRPHIHELAWSKRELLELVARRLREKIPLPESPLLMADLAVWQRFFSPRVKDADTLFNEDSFQYVLNHTFYRPRDMIVVWDEIAKFIGPKLAAIPDAAVRDGVAKSCKELYKGVLSENGHVPYLKRLLGQFWGSSNVIARSDFFDQVGVASDEIQTSWNMDHATEGQLVEEFVGRLWAIGFFGVLVPDSVEGDIPKEMGWADQVVRAAVFSFVDDSANYSGAATYVIHPVFHTSLQIQPERHVVIRVGG